jgi:transposase
MRFVPVKTVEQQAALTMLGVRDLLVKQRSMLLDAIRGHAAEFGVTVAKSLPSESGGTQTAGPAGAAPGER